MCANSRYFISLLWTVHTVLQRANTHTRYNVPLQASFVNIMYECAKKWRDREREKERERKGAAVSFDNTSVLVKARGSRKHTSSHFYRPCTQFAG